MCQCNITFVSQVFFYLLCADAVALAPLSGLVGHHGKNGCRIYCSMPGRNKHKQPIYYPACYKPSDRNVLGSHPDIPINALTVGCEDRYETNLRYLKAATSKTGYEERRKETGICKPSLFSGLPRSLPVPKCFCLDIMHLPALNLPELLLGLWRATLKCDKDDSIAMWTWAENLAQPDVWKEHGKAVADATPYLPGSFDRPPRNPAEKLNSGYKAWEFLTYIYGLGPALFYDVLPEAYWRHYCKLVAGIRIISQRSLTPQQLQTAHKLLNEFAEEFELLYYQRKHARLHFVRPSIHTIRHLAQEVQRIGPGACSSQWTIERTIGNLGEEVKQPSNPFANLAQHGIRRCQTNALKAMVPDLDPPLPLPRGSIALDNSFVLLRAIDNIPRPVRPPEAVAINRYLREAGGMEQDESEMRVTRWARLRLPNGQVARSAWKEHLKALKQVRMARNVKVYSFHFNSLCITLTVLSVTT